MLKRRHRSQHPLLRAVMVPSRRWVAMVTASALAVQIPIGRVLGTLGTVTTAASRRKLEVVVVTPRSALPVVVAT